MEQLDTARYLDVVEHSGRRFLDLARDTDPATPVDWCGEWTVADLTEHLGAVWGWTAIIVESGSQEPPTEASPERGDLEPVDFAAAQHQAMVPALRALEPTAAIWSWTEQKTGSFWHRRQAHETAVHTWDLETAAGIEGATIEPDLAHDGIEELIAVGLNAGAAGGGAHWPVGSLHLHRTDGEGEWLLASRDGEAIVTREHAKGDVAVRGSAAQLLLWMWDRPNAVEVFGDTGLAAEWQACSP